MQEHVPLKVKKLCLDEPRKEGRARWKGRKESKEGRQAGIFY
jgi:hypothetical protein